MKTIPLELVETHVDVPVTYVSSTHSFHPSKQTGVSKYEAQLPNKANFNALLINKQSDVLIVALHGATNRVIKELPRFEWMRTLRKTEYSSMYFSDPGLELDDQLTLAWYTGWKDLNVYKIMADWITVAASSVGASKVLILGSSGGGFASLQVSALIPGSMALPFSCQTSISAYLGGGTRLNAQRAYLRAVMPHLSPPVPLEDLDPSVDWAAPMSDRLSAVERYKRPLSNYVYYVQNSHDYPHVEQHYLPFRKIVENSANRDRVRFVKYDGPESHNPPTNAVFREYLEAAISWLRTIG